ncbi:glycosyltransferase family 39 protein [bacterium]|nr:glycosyltransferase family 39 protein [bacterium]
MAEDSGPTLKTLVTSILIIFLVICVGALYLFDLPLLWRSQDEKCYMWLADNIWRGHGFSIGINPDTERDFLWGMPSVASGHGLLTIKYPVGQSCLLAAALAAGGHGLAFYLVPVLGLMTVFCVFLIAYLISGNLKLAFLSAALVSVCPTWLIHSRSLLSDIPATTTIYWSLYLCMLAEHAGRKWLYPLAGLVLAIGILIRYPTLLALVPMLLLLCSAADRQKQRWLNLGLLMLPCSVAIIMILLINLHLFGSPWTTGYAAIGESGFNPDRFLLNLLNYLAISCIILPGAGLALLWFSVRPTRLIERRHLIPLLILPALYILFYSLWGNLVQLSYKPQDLLVLGARLVLPAVPALAIVLGLFLIHACTHPKIPGWIVWLIPVVLVLISLSVRHPFEQRTRDFATANLFIQSSLSQNGLVFLKSHWFKIIWPHNPNVSYAIIPTNGLSERQKILIDKYLHRLHQPVFFLLDPYIRLGLFDHSWHKETVLDDLRAHGYAVTRQQSLDIPFEIELFKLESAHGT